MTLPDSGIERLVTEARPTVFWSDRPEAPTANRALGQRRRADLVIIGGGFTGLWTALHAARQEPGREIVILEAEVCGFGASSRNGGFCAVSLTHGLLNGIAHWPDEIATLDRMGRQNLAELIADCESLQIDASIERSGELCVATASWQSDHLVEMRDVARAHGSQLELLDETAVRGQLDSPTYRSGLWDPDGTVMVDPARLVWGLQRSCIDAGVRIYDNSRVNDVSRVGSALEVSTEDGVVTAPKVVVATNAWGEPGRSIRRYVVPVYDHVLMTEPLGQEQLDSIGWSNRQGVGDSANQFHYYRLTADNRILWGGHDANYYRGNGMGPEYELRTGSHVTIAHHFFDTFPQLEGVRFSHRWAGPIGTTSKFAAAFGSRHDGDLVWVGGYTGLGVGASRWGARTAIDLVDGQETERTELRMVRKKPFPFPPEPLRNPVIQFTRRQIAKADQNEGQLGVWLRLLERFGVGFDS